MPWKCDQCGFQANADATRACEACGFVKFGNLMLLSEQTGRSIRMTIDTLVGKSLLRSFAGDDAVYSSEPQFKIYKDSALGGWAVEPSPGVKNPTYVDGSALEIAVALKEGTVITLGLEKMKLTARLDG